jgi:hypothetical protein
VEWKRSTDSNTLYVQLKVRHSSNRWASRFKRGELQANSKLVEVHAESKKPVTGGLLLADIETKSFWTMNCNKSSFHTILLVDVDSLSLCFKISTFMELGTRVMAE